LKQIRSLISGRLSYIVPGYPTNEDLYISCLVRSPLFCGDPIKCHHAVTKAEARKIFQQANFPIAPGAGPFTTPEEFYQNLANLLVTYPEITTWFFKMNTEFQSRGIAY